MKKLFILPIIFFFSCAKDNHSSAQNKEDHTTLLKTNDGDIFDLVRSPVSSNCPEDMVEVEGDYCPQIEEHCNLWLDPTATNGGEGPVRCAEFAPSKCLSKKRKYLNFCIDKYEFPNIKGAIPQVYMSWNSAKLSCENEGKRLCQDYEWTFACEGEDIKSYPYGDGLHRDAHACNIDNPWIDPWKNSFDKLDQRVPSGSMNCQSKGIYDLTGNVDEFVVNSSGKPYVSALKGGHNTIGARNRCSVSTISHNSEFAWYETGTRCCSNINK